ncbi:MAG TPA: peptidase M48 Ste24p [Spirochaetaceae bacterium]|jgi:Zn-dependent protease with chaperone function|nr:peptidase M48 Ste24p [Spirochaetaceae bacterium]
MLVPRVRKLYDIDPRSWEHPADRAALGALKQLKGLDELVSSLVSMSTERSLKLMQLASSVKVTERQFPRVHTLMGEVVDTFDWPYRPPVFVTQSPFFNAGVLGVKEPFIVLNSSLLRGFDESELKAVLAHEFAHIMSGHTLYKTLIWMVTNISLLMLPITQLLLRPIIAALAEWNRKSELSADRAELLAVQDDKPSLNVLMRMAGGEDLSQVNLNDFFEQAQEYDNQKTLLDSIHKLLNQLWLSHPYPVERIQELKSWSSSGAYRAILDGNYLKRGLSTAKAEEEIKAGFDFYKKELEESDDPLARLATGLGQGIEKAVGDLGDTIKDLFGRG